MTKAIYAFSGDPITFGHIDIIKRAAKIFPELVVGIGENPDKEYTFTTEERLDMARKTLMELPDIEVVSFKGLLVDFAYENKIDVIVRGIRGNDDLSFEKVLYELNISQDRGIETVFLPADQKFAHISSRIVKSMVMDGAYIHEYVPLYVKQKLEEKLLGKYIIAITGEIGSGKSYVANKIVEDCKKNGIEAVNIELDEIGHEILEGHQDNVYAEIRLNIINKFGKDVANPDGSINRKKLGEIVFTQKEKLEELNSIMLKPILVRLRHRIKDKKGLIILNAALIAESGISFLSNNNVILLNVNSKVQRERLKTRGFDDEQINRRVESQFNSEVKKEMLLKAVNKTRYGTIWEIENNDIADSEIQKVSEELRNYFALD